MSITHLTKNALYVPSIVFESGTLSSSNGKITWNGSEIGSGNSGSNGGTSGGSFDASGDITFTGLNTFTQSVTFNAGMISNGDIVLNGTKLLLVNGAAVEVYPDENLPVPQSRYADLHYNALYNEMTETLLNNATYHLNEVESINFALDNELDGLFSCKVVFTSGVSPTIVTNDSRIKWIGEDTNNGIFTPIANTRYSCSLEYDGLFVRGTIEGISII